MGSATKSGILAGAMLLCCVAQSDRTLVRRPISHGGIWEASLSVLDSDSRDPHRRPRHEYLLKGRPGQVLTINARSFEADTTVEARDASGRMIGVNEDGGWFGNAWLTIRMPETGRSVVTVCGADADQTGSYWLAVNEGRHAPELSASAVEAYYTRGRDWASEHGSRRAVGRLLVFLARYYRVTGRWDEAEATLEELAGHLVSSHPYALWSAELERGRLMARLARYGDAEAAFVAANRYLPQLRSARLAECAVLLDEAGLFENLSRRQLADTLHKKAESLMRDDAPATLRVRYLTSHIGCLPKAERARKIEMATEAERLADRVDPALALDVLRTRLNSSLVDADPGLVDSMIVDGIALADVSGVIDAAVELRLIWAMNRIISEDEDGAMEAAYEAVRVANGNDPNPSSIRIAHQVIADIKAGQGRMEEAIEQCRLALTRVESAWETDPTTEGKIRRLAEVKAVSSQMLGFLCDAGEKADRGWIMQALELSERARARTLLASLEAPRTSSGLLPAPQSATGAQDRISRVGQNMLLLRSASADRTGSRLAVLEQERARLVAAGMLVQASHPTPEVLEEAPKPLREVLVDIEKLHPGAGILAYTVGVRRGFLIAIARGDIQIFPVPKWDEIRTRVNRWRALVAMQARDPANLDLLKEYAALSRELYQMLIAPAAGMLRGLDLVIIPDSSLYDLAFEGLVIDGPVAPKSYGEMRFLVSEHSLAYAPSISSLWALENRALETERKVVLIGDPVFSPADRRTSTSIGETHPQKGKGQPSQASTQPDAPHSLPETRREVQAIASLARDHGYDVQVLLGMDASEDVVKSDSIEGARIVHFATHAFDDPVSGNFSGVVLSLPGGDGVEDGLLTAAEVSGLNVSAELVLLSGCSTGLGQATVADGVVGLSQAFLTAGAKRVCASYWNVEDSSTRMLMTAFYEQLLAEGQSPARALRESKLRLIRAGATPFQWASFILIGPS